jgi:hypothetical protein
MGKQEWRGNGVDDMTGFGIIRNMGLYAGAWSHHGQTILELVEQETMKFRFRTQLPLVRLRGLWGSDRLN